MSATTHWLHRMLLAALLLSSSALAQEASVFSKASNDSLLWGVYRPNLYFGVRSRLPKSLIAGLMWSRVDDYASVQHNMRHTCEQNEGMAGYGWDSYDLRTGGTQVVRDLGNGVDISTDFVKFPEKGDNGGSWGVKVKGTVRPDAPLNRKTTVIFYVALEGLGSVSVDETAGDAEELGFLDDVSLTGHTTDLGDFKVVVTNGKGEHPTPTGHAGEDEDPLDRTLVQSMSLPELALWQAKSVLFTNFKTTIDKFIKTFSESNMPPPANIYRLQNTPGNGNLHLIQKTFEGDFEFDVLYTQGAETQIKVAELNDRIEQVEKKIEERFINVLSPSKPFQAAHLQDFSRSLLSNLIGGIGFFHGDQVIDRSYAPEYEEENEGFWEETAAARERKQQQLEGPYELFTTTPSRTFFPRGFLWDEGLNLIPILDWDIELTLQIIKSWFNTMDEDGWIPREQILGAEARSKVPEEFQTQYPHYANPPTLFLIIDELLDLSKETSIPNSHPHITSGASVKAYLTELYPLLKRQFEWFRRTQRGEISAYDRTAYSTKEAYRWRGRTVRHLLTSGLDDYPRAPKPHPAELHVDLMSWVGMMTKVLERLATTLDLADDAAEFASVATAIERNVVDLHWSPERDMFCDATVDDYEDSVHVCHAGYISLFPFALGLLEHGQDDKVRAVLDLIADEAELWSAHGIRSLSRRDRFYGTDENYWRGPVWIPINYMVLRRLLILAKTPTSPNAAQARQLYIDLRKNLVGTVYDSWVETGFAWEQYDPETGRGQRTQHFTGWTSLVVKIMAMEDLEGGIAGGGEEGQAVIRDEL